MHVINRKVTFQTERRGWRLPSKLWVCTASLVKRKLIIKIIPRNGSTSELVEVRSLFPPLLGKRETQSLKTERNQSQSKCPSPRGLHRATIRDNPLGNRQEKEREDPVQMCLTQLPPSVTDLNCLMSSFSPPGPTSCERC